MIRSLSWVWYWQDHDGKLHMTTDPDEAERTIHSVFGLTVWAERIPESGGVMIKDE
jgi:hypothetical protein